MCGRFTLRASLSRIAKDLKAQAGAPLFDALPRYNIAPTQPVAAVRLNGEGERELVLLRWGLVPSWADDLSIGSRLINARAETAASKPSFRSAFKQRRCLIVADGFYEWQKAGSRKQPFYVRLRDDRPFGFAGLWERWGQNESAIESCTILTTQANELMAPIHHRMPLIVAPADHQLWLDTGAAPDRLQSLLRPYPADEMETYPVSTLVNSPGNDVPQCVEPAGVVS